MNSSRNASLLSRLATEIALGAVILVILMIGAFVGNVLTSLVFWRRPRLRTFTNISILFLALREVLMAGLVMPFSLASLIKGEWSSSPEACAFNVVFIHSLLGVSLTTMATTATIRYLCVVKTALHHQYAKPKIVAAGISILWPINSILQVFSLVVLSGRGAYSLRQIYCLYYAREIQKAVVNNIINYSGFAGAVILGLLIVLAYFKVFRFVSHHNNTLASNLQQGNTSDIEEAKITKTFVNSSFRICSLLGPSNSNPYHTYVNTAPISSLQNAHVCFPTSNHMCISQHLYKPSYLCF